MLTPADNFIRGAMAARKLANECLIEAQTDPERAFYLIAEHDRHIDRAEFYELHASWYAQEIEHEEAA